jgi:predicted N-acetyltransferase YhbS
MPVVPVVPAHALAPNFEVRAVTVADHAEIGALHDAVFGPGALTRAAYRVREGVPCHSDYCRATRDAARGHALIAFCRFTPISIGAQTRALMLGPVAVAAGYANQGHARRLIVEGLDAARAGGEPLVLLVGDLPYYGRLGFVAVTPGRIRMPGPVDPARLLAAELVAGALVAAAGLVRPRVSV